VASVEQWDGDAYHPNIRLASAANTDVGWIPYDPAIYLAYSGASALYQFDDAFVAGQGIEVLEAADVLEPTIFTDAVPGATVGQPWSVTLSAGGDPPLLWSLVKAPIGMAIGLQSGELAWTPSSSDTPSVSITVKLRNDSGTVTRDYTVNVADPSSPDAASPDGSAHDAKPDGVPGADGSASSDTGLNGSDAQPGADSAPPAWNGNESDEGCSCRAGAGASRAPFAWLVIAALGVMRTRRRYF